MISAQRAYTPVAEMPEGEAFPGRGEETLFATAYTRVYRLSLPGGGRVICKEIRGAGALKRFEHEKGILEKLSGIAGVPQLAGGDYPAGIIAMEESGARTLDRLEAPWPFERLLPFAVALAETVRALHGAGVAHKNITPDNILLCGEEPLLIDYSLATTFAEERPPFLHHNEIAGTLPYLAPEQTGRTGRSVDERADLYATGAVLYRLATGTPPFAGEDPLQLVHDILARRALPPHELNEALPPLFCALIMRLLEKEPERRYQSAAGVAHDLRRLRGGPGDFPLGERDFPARLTTPSRLIGRDVEIAALTGALDGALEGGGMAVFVSGDAGVGKTALAHELRHLVTARRGWFVSGKFDQYRNDPAATATVQALRALGRLLLAEPEVELARHRRRLLSALGRNAGLISASLPEFAVVLGSEPEVMPDDPTEAQAKLFAAGLDLLRCVVSPHRPLVMFIDDLQWAGQSSVAFLDTVLCDLRLDGFLLVAAYRESELGGARPVSAVLPRWRALESVSLSLSLANLSSSGLAELLEEMLRLTGAEAASLARAVALRTAGNPYHTLEFLNALRKEGILHLTEEGWKWEESDVLRALGHGDVQEVLSKRLAALPEETSAVLREIACLGGEVEEEVLAAVSDSAEMLPSALRPAMEDGVLVIEQQGEWGRVLRFRHDRAQHSVYDGIPADSRNDLHLALARRLSVLPRLGLAAAEQYLHAFGEVIDSSEIYRVVLLFWEAAQDARGTANYPSMERFLAAAVMCCAREPSLWQEPLLDRLEIAWHKALFSLGRLDEGDRVYRSIERRCGCAQELVEAACIQMSSLTNRGRPAESVALGLELLQRLGFPCIPLDETETARELEYLHRWAQGGDDEEERRPEVVDPLLLAVARVLHHCVAPAFFSSPALCYQLQLHSLRLWRERGACASLLIGFAATPLVTMALANDYSTGCRATQRALAVGRARGYEPETSWVRHCFGLLGAHWVQPLELSVREASLAREGLLAGGDLQFACFTYHTSLQALFDSAPSIASFREELERATAFAERTGNGFSMPMLVTYRQLLRALLGETDRWGSFADGSFEPGGYLASLPGHPMAQVKYHIHRALSAAVFGDDAALAAHAGEAYPLLQYVHGFYKNALGHLLQALALARGLAGAAGGERAKLLDSLAVEKEWLRARAADCPENFLHLLHLVEAEESWGMGDREGAAFSFDTALLAAEGRQRPWHRALITERAALFQRDQGLIRGARKLLVEARYLYDAWGASGKVRQLEESHPFLLGAVTQRRAADHAPAGSFAAESLELLAIVRASQALSSERSLDRLKGRVVELLEASTGATGVLLVLRSEEDGWVVLTGSEEAPPLAVADAGAAGILPLSPFRYVQRTGEPLLVEDAVHDQRFCRDPYLARVQHCSLMLVPIEMHGSPQAFLILENRLSSAAFTRERLDSVKLMAGQLAVSLENARLYEKLEERVAERTRELEKAQEELVATARQAGMAEIATNVLHNVGNVLNSVNISAGVLTGALRDSRAGGVARAAELMKEHAGELGEYLTRDPKGRLLPPYLEKLAGVLEKEQRGLMEELGRLTRSVDHIKEIVATQQAYAGCSSLLETVRVADLLEDALRMNEGALSRHQVTVVRDFAEVPPVTLDKARLLQILVNLISNAKYAMDRVRGARLLTLSLASDGGGTLVIRVSDEGEGIAPENLSRVFSHGFTTRKNGHGFGLHSCALAAKEMGGTLSAQSAGKGRGATFTLELPCALPAR